MSPFGGSGPQYDLYSNAPAGGSPFDTGYYQHFNAMANLPSGSRLSQPTTGTVSATPMYNAALGVWVNSQTGQPYAGADPVTGRRYVRGQPVTEPVPYSGGQQINPNDPYQLYQAVNIPKSPEIADATAQMIKNFTKSSNSVVPDFKSVLGQYQQQLGGSLAQTRAATNTDPVSAQTTAQQQAYANALNQFAQQYQTLNAQGRQDEQALAQMAQNFLPAFDQAMNNILGLQLGGAREQASRFQLRPGGVPGALDSGVVRELARATNAVAAPLEMAKINQLYNVLDQYVRPAILDPLNRETTRIGTFNPAIAAAIYQSGQGTALTNQDLAMRAAQQYQSALGQYPQLAALPYTLQQQLFGGQVGSLGGLSNIYSGSMYQGLQNRLGTNVTPTVGYNVNTGPYPPPGRYTGNYGLGTARGPSYPATGTATGTPSWDQMQSAYAGQIGGPGLMDPRLASTVRYYDQPGYEVPSTGTAAGSAYNWLDQPGQEYAAPLTPGATV